MTENLAEMNQQKERKIPVFSVLKNNSIIKNIFLTEPPSPISSPSSILSIEKKNSGIDTRESEEIFVVGRHPDCNIKLEHPSISRFHLRIHSIPSLQSLSVSDLSSVHGTWVCGKRIEPDIRVKLQEGDTLQLGVSSRIYRLHWVPLSGIYDFSNPCLPTIDESEPLEEKEEEEELLQKDQGSLCGEHDLSLKLGGGDTEESDGITFTFSGYIVEDEIEERPECENCLCPDDHSETKNDDWEDIKLFAGMNMTLQSKPMTPSSFTLDCVPSPFLSKEDKIFESSLNCHESTHQQVTEMVEREDKKGEDCLSLQLYQNLAADDGLEDLSFLFTDMNMITESNQWTPSENLMPADEKSPFSGDDMEVEKKAGVFSSSTFLQPVSPSAPLDPEGTKSNITGEEEGNNSPFDHGRDSSPHSTKNKYWNPSALAFPGDAKIQFCYRDEEGNSNGFCTGITDMQTPEHAKQNKSPNDSCISGKSQPKSPCTPSPRSRSNMSKRRSVSDCVQTQAHMSVGSTPSPCTISDVKPLNQENLIIGPASDYFCEGRDKAEELVLTPDKENCTPEFLRNRSLKKIDRTKVKCELHLESLTYSSDGENEETFTPDKENISPATRLLRSMKKVEAKEVKPKTNRSPLKNVDSNVYKVVGKSSSSGKVIELRKLLHGKKTARAACKSDKEREPDVYVSKGRPDKAPLQVLSVNSDGRNPEALNLDVTDTKSCSSMNNPNVNKPICLLNVLEEKTKKWTMVVDSACLLDKESRKALQLMQGFPRTNMIIPTIVIMELVYLKKRCSLFRSTKQASAALQWIEDCMVNAQAGIHVQSAMEDNKSHITPTLLASLLSFFSDYKTKFQIGSAMEIISPTAEDQILDCAVKLRRTRDNGQVVLLSDNISLKIKAMAEGLLCESAKQFRESLVNPFSDRFLWPHSSPRGLTWTCIDDVVLKNEYHNGCSKKQSKSGENAKGLKLVLHYSQIERKRE